MQSIFNLRTTYSLPLCLSGVTRFHHLSLSTQIADHDRIRKEVKRNLIPANEIYGEVREIEVRMIRSPDLVMFNFNLDDGDDGDDRGYDQSSVRQSSCAAKAA